MKQPRAKCRKKPSCSNTKDRVQTYQGDLAPCKYRKDLVNWTLVTLGNTKAKLTNNSRPEQRQWQRPNDNDATEDYLDPDIVERDAI